MTKRVRVCENCQHWQVNTNQVVCPSGLCTMTMSEGNACLAKDTSAVAKMLNGVVLRETRCALVTRPDHHCGLFLRKSS